MKTLWDSRYEADHFVYGKDPNRFFASEITKLTTGTMLLPGEGEGRNAVFAASKGWVVDAFDQSQAGFVKARNLAFEMGAEINYQVCTVEDFAFIKDHYDAVGLTFFHTPPKIRELLHSKVIETLKPGGVVILEAFHTSNLGNGSGPQSQEMLFNQDKIQNDFRDLETMQYEELQITLNEGPFHQGSANIVRYTGMKK